MLCSPREGPTSGPRRDNHPRRVHDCHIERLARWRRDRQLQPIASDRVDSANRLSTVHVNGQRLRDAGQVERSGRIEVRDSEPVLANIERSTRWLRRNGQLDRVVAGG